MFPRELQGPLGQGAAQMQRGLQGRPTHSPSGLGSLVTGAVSLQVAAYGGKLRYTLSYTAELQGSPLSDPDVQIMVSTWPSGRGRRGKGPRTFLGSVSGGPTARATEPLLISHSSPRLGTGAGHRCQSGHMSLGEHRWRSLVARETGTNGGPFLSKSPSAPPSNPTRVFPGQQHHAGGLPGGTTGPREEELRDSLPRGRGAPRPHAV